MANMEKYSDMRDIGHLCAHYERSVQKGHYGNSDIDQERLDEDRTNLAPDRGKQTDYIKKQIEKIMDGRTMRKDAVRMCCWVVNAPANMPDEMKPKFFQAVYDFLTDRYGSKSGIGEDVVVSAYIHKSETTDHMHYSFMPILEKNGQKTFCAKECVGRSDLASFHSDLGEYLENLGICKKRDILNGKTQRDSRGRALSVKELKRNRIIDRERKVDRWSGQVERAERQIGRW